METGSMKMTYVMQNDSGGYFRGTVTYKGKNHPCNFFQIANVGDDELENQDEIKWRCCQGSRSLLCPFIVNRSSSSNDLIDIGYIFDSSFEEWLQSDKAVKLFKFEESAMNSWWSAQILEILHTLLKIHTLFIYHGGLSDRNNYTISDDRLTLVKPKHVRESRDTQLEEQDFVDFREFCSRLIQDGEPTSRYWRGFLDSFPTFLKYNAPSKNVLHLNVSWLIKHPVLKDPTGRFDHLKLLVHRALHACDLYRKYEDMSDELSRSDPLCKGWKLRITSPDYKKVFNIGIYKDDDNLTLVRFVENATKHVNKDRKRGNIDRNLDSMFPGFLLRLHTFSAIFSLENPEFKFIPGEENERNYGETSGSVADEAAN